MAIVKTSWEEFLSTESEILHEVHFLAIGENEGNENDSRKLIGAHKVLLAGVSPVFRGMLFGSLKETREVIELQDTTHEAFHTMIKYLYNPQSSIFNLDHISCAQKLFELLNLATRYEISSLASMTAHALRNLGITLSLW